MAIKYGITLDQTSPTNYVASDGSVIWDAALNGDYHNNIFGIGRDTLSLLNQKVSQVNVQDGSITMALDKDFTSPNLSATRTTNHINDKQYLILSDNGGAISRTGLAELPTGSTDYDVRIDREWRVSKTANFNQTVNLKFHGFQSTDILKFFVMKDSDGDFTSGAVEVGALDDQGEISGVTLEDGEYLTLFLTAFTPGGVKGGLQNGVSFEFYEGYDSSPEDGITGTLLSTGYINNLTNVDDIFLEERQDQFSLVLRTKNLCSYSRRL